MKSPFDANVPRRKPRTRLSTMLAELDGVAPESELPHPLPEEGGPSDLSRALDPGDETGNAARKGSAQAYRAEPYRPEPPIALVRTSVESLPQESTREHAQRRGIEASQVSRAGRPSDALGQAAALREAPSDGGAIPGDGLRQTHAQQVPVHDAGLHQEDPEQARSAVDSASDDGGMSMSRIRISELRRRLLDVEQRSVSAQTPQGTASKVRETVRLLRAQLDQARAERTEFEQALDTARAEITAAEDQAEAERKARRAAEAVAEERRSVAEALMAESENLADERDQALRRIAELRGLEAEQAELLVDLERAIEARTEELKRKEEELVDLQSTLEATVVDLESAQARLDAELADGHGLRRRIAHLEAELDRSRAVADALSEIDELVDGAARPGPLPTNGQRAGG